MPPLGRSASEARKGKDRESIEHRRARSEVGCSECRRLKLRCDNSIPCNACTKRGCQIICSNGTLSSGQESRFIPIDTKNVHRKLLEMSKRISQLEDALKISHAAISNAQHPLLSAELLKMKAGISPHHNDKKWGNAVGDELDKDIMSSFGDLTVTERDGGGDAFLVQHIDRDPPAPPEDSDAQSQPALPFQVSHLSRSFPFGPRYLPKLEIQQLIEMRLPLFNRASSLCESYLESISWWIRPIDRSQLLEELMPTVYGNRRASSSMHVSGSSEGQKKTDPHDLAALLMVFAIGAVGDFTLSPNNEEAELYFHLSRSALCLNPVFDGASLASVQTIALMGAYDMFSFRKKSLESTWKVLNFGMTLATSIGLHRDPTHWKFEPKMIQRRRTVFWELRNLDAWKSLASGRPSTIAPDDVDCELPIDSDATLDEEGKEVPSFWRWKHLFLRDVLSKIAQKLCSAKPLKYSEILELDQTLREFGPIHLCDQVASAIGNRGYSGSEGTRAYLQQYLLSLLKDMALQFLHRNFFARALLENPANPMQSAFAPSFIAAYNSAYSLSHVIREHFDVISHVMLRYWSAWTHSLTACVIIGSVAARAPSSDLAPRAYVELLLSLDVFAKAQMHPAVRSGLPVLQRLRERAYRALVGAGIDPDSIPRDTAFPGRPNGQANESSNPSTSITNASAPITSISSPVSTSSNTLHTNPAHSPTRAQLYAGPVAGYAAAPPSATYPGLASGIDYGLVGYANYHPGQGIGTVGSGYVYDGLVGSGSQLLLSGSMQPEPGPRSLHPHPHSAPGTFAGSSSPFTLQPQGAALSSSSLQDASGTNTDASASPGVGTSTSMHRTGLGYAHAFNVQEPDFAALMELGAPSSNGSASSGSPEYLWGAQPNQVTEESNVDGSANPGAAKTGGSFDVELDDLLQQMNVPLQMSEVEANLGPAAWDSVMQNFTASGQASGHAYGF